MASVMRFDQWQDSNGVPVATGAGGKFSAPGSILQVVQTVKTDVFTSSSNTFEDVTGMTVTITPKSASSKVLVSVFINFTNSVGRNSYFRVLRGTTPLAVGDTVGTGRVFATFSGTGDFRNVGYGINSVNATLLDSPNTTSATTYKVDCRRDNDGVLTVNRDGIDADSVLHGRIVSTITALEVAA